MLSSLSPKRMLRIAQVAPLCESVPPRLYGGTERVVAYLTDELVRLGHDVTLFASGDSQTRAKLVAVRAEALRLSGSSGADVTAHTLLVEKVAQRAAEFDLVHFHLSDLHLPLARRLTVPSVTTMHGRLDLPELTALFQEFSEAPLVSISDAQRRPLRHACWAGTVYHGIPADLFRFQPRPGTYFAFVGRVSPEKGVDRAIAIAEACGCPIRIAAKVDPVDQRYFDRDIAPLLARPFVEFAGEIDDVRKDEFIGGARALLFPIDWPEPFGLVMIEALACGVPVIAFRAGSVPEIIEDGVTGFIVDSIDEAVAAAGRIDTIDRAACRAEFERRFTVNRMARAYLQIYHQQIARMERAHMERHDTTHARHAASG
jgi:glycosyltransferase involved in cell wall biosynthesis